MAARRTVNGLLVSVAGLIAVAVGNELVVHRDALQLAKGTAWYQQVLKGAIILRSAAAVSAGGRWRVNQHRPPDDVMKG